MIPWLMAIALGAAPLTDRGKSAGATPASDATQLRLRVTASEAVAGRVDFGAVSEAGGEPSRGHRIETADGTFLVVDVSATATYHARFASGAPPRGRKGSAHRSPLKTGLPDGHAADMGRSGAPGVLDPTRPRRRSASRTEPSRRQARSPARGLTSRDGSLRASHLAASPTSGLPRNAARATSAATVERLSASSATLELWVRAASSQGASRVFLSTDGSWSPGSLVELGSHATTIDLPVIAGEPVAHQLGIWLPADEVGQQLHGVEYGVRFR